MRKASSLSAEMSKVMEEEEERQQDHRSAARQHDWQEEGSHSEIGCELPMSPREWTWELTEQSPPPTPTETPTFGGVSEGESNPTAAATAAAKSRYSNLKSTSGFSGVHKERSVDEEWKRFMRSKGLMGSATTVLTATTFSESWSVQVVLCAIICTENALIGIDIDTNTTSTSRSGRSAAWDVLEIVFLVFWTVFNVLHLRAEGCAYFRSRWNHLEMFLIILGLADLFIANVLDEDSAKFGDFSALRFLRILKLLRLARLGHVVGSFQELRLITNGFVKSFRTLGWVSILLFIAVYSAALYVTIVVGHTCSSHYDEWRDCDTFFGRVPKSMLTLFQIMTLDDWSMEIARPVLKEKTWLMLFFLPFMMLTTFGLLNIIVGVIVENTLSSASEQRRKEQEKANETMRKDLIKLKRLFMEADQDGDGNVDREEFRVICKNNEIKTLMKDLGLPNVPPDRLFEVIDADIQGTISIGEFIEGCLRLKEMPSALDMHTMLMQIHYMMVKVSRLEKMMRQTEDVASQALSTFGQTSFRQSFAPTFSRPDALAAEMLEQSQDTPVSQMPHCPRKSPPKRHISPIPAETLGSPRSANNMLISIREDVLALASRFLEIEVMERGNASKRASMTPTAPDTSRGRARLASPLMTPRTPKQAVQLPLPESQMEALELKITDCVQRSVDQAFAAHQHLVMPRTSDTAQRGSTEELVGKESRERRPREILTS